MASRIKGLHNKSKSIADHTLSPSHKDLIQGLDLALENVIPKSLFQPSSPHYQNLFQLAPVAYFTIDENGLITDANLAATDLLGIQHSMLLNRSLSRYIAPEYLTAYSEFRTSKPESSGLRHCELKLMKRNGPLFYGTLHGQMDMTDSTHTLLIALTNIRPHKQDMVASDNIDATNAINTTLISQLNNSLGVLGNYMSGCIRRLEGENPNITDIHFALTQSTQHINRISQYLLRMRNVFYNENIELRPVNLHELLCEAIGLIKEENANSPVKIIYRKNTNIASVEVEKLFILHVFLNLMRNAFDALQDADISDPTLSIQVNQPDEGVVEISFRDNGPGFQNSDIEKIFNTTYTTKSYGLGLGLAVSKMIVESHGGTLTCELNITYGACFKLTLPLI